MGDYMAASPRWHTAPREHIPGPRKRPHDNLPHRSLGPFALEIATRQSSRVVVGRLQLTLLSLVFFTRGIDILGPATRLALKRKNRRRDLFRFLSRIPPILLLEIVARFSLSQFRTEANNKKERQGRLKKTTEAGHTQASIQFRSP